MSYKRMKENNNDRDLLTNLLMSGIMNRASKDEVETYGELFKEVDLLLELVVIKSETSQG